MTLHFVIGTEDRSGKSWFIRGLVECLQQFGQVAVVDASANKLLGNIYNPHLNKVYNLRFDACNNLLADRTIELAQQQIALIIKVPAADIIYFQKWVKDIEIWKLEIVSYIWIVGRFLPDDLAKTFDVFEIKLHFVHNQYFGDSALAVPLKQRNIDRVMLPRFAATLDTNAVEKSEQTLRALFNSSNCSFITKVRIQRFLSKMRSEVMPILSG